MDPDCQQLTNHKLWLITGDQSLKITSTKPETIGGVSLILLVWLWLYLSENQIKYNNIFSNIKYHYMLQKVPSNHQITMYVHSKQYKFIYEWKTS